MCEEGVGRMKFTAGQLKHIYIPGCWEDSQPLKYWLVELVRAKYYLDADAPVGWLGFGVHTSNRECLVSLCAECTAEFEPVPLAHLG